MFQLRLSLASTSSAPAPVAIFAFRRLSSLRLVLEALGQCPEFSRTPLVVFSDGPRPGHPDDSEAVADVRHFLRGWCRSHRAELIEFEENRGLRQSIVSGVTQLVEEHGKVIVLEDDIVVSPGFLEFMNSALEAFTDRADLVQVSGYLPPVRCSLPETGLVGVPACWGWATWDRAWRLYRDDAEELLAEIPDSEIGRFNLDDTYDYHTSLRENACAVANTWMVRWYASVFLEGGLTLYPGQSLTRNVGFDDQGTHCRGGNRRVARAFQRQRIARRAPSLDPVSIGQTETPEFREALKEFYRWQQAQWSRPTKREIWRARCRRLLGRDWRVSADE